MRESRTYGSVRGARGNPRPYRDCIGTGLGATLWVGILKWPMLLLLM